MWEARRKINVVALVFRIVQPLLYGSTDVWCLTFGVVPHSVLEGCKTNTFMKKNCFAAEIKLSLFV